MFQELKSILVRLQELLGANHPDCILLASTLTCRNCKLSRFKGKVDGISDVWYCNQWQANIPPDAVASGCDCWKNNIGVGQL